MMSGTYMNIAKLGGQTEEMKKEESKKTSTPTPTPAPASTPAQSSTLPEAQSGKDMLDEWGL